MKAVLLTVEIRSEPDVVLARQRARLIAELLALDLQDQTRIATAVSELARNVFQYAEGGRVQFGIRYDEDEWPCFAIKISDRGRGIAHLDEILCGTYRSKTGMGVGLRGARQLVDHFRIETSDTGTTVELDKRLPPRTAHRKLDLAELSSRLAAHAAKNPIDEVRQQNHELMRALEELKAREEELTRLNDELSEATTGVLALYAELEEKAEALRGTSALKARFHSQMSHEVRTPINSILSISELLLNGTAGIPLPSQEKPLGFIRKAAQQLSELVDDLLDLAKVEAGKMTVRLESFSVPDLFGALRGMFRPLHRNAAVRLIFQDSRQLPPLETDEGKISQVLRNFISNALKFTERGEVRVSARQDGERIIFSVSDTGIGISAADQALLFRDFSQIESAQQRRVRGTGLGLALVRDLAELLRGEVSVTSEAGKGSTFSLSVPRVLSAQAPAPPAASPEEPALEELGPVLHQQRIPVMVLATQLSNFRRYEQLLDKTRFKLLPVSSSTVARQLTDNGQLRVIIFDGDPISERNWQLLAGLHRDRLTDDVAVLMVSGAAHRARAEALGVRGFAASPPELRRVLEQLALPERADRAGPAERADRAEPVDRLERGGPAQPPVLHSPGLAPDLAPGLAPAAAPPPRPILIIDDDEAARFALRMAIAELPYPILEIGNGLEGLREAHLKNPLIVFLDLTMPGIDGFDVLAQLKGDPQTADIPVIINSARRLTAEERRWLTMRTALLLDKAHPIADLSSRVREVLAGPSLRRPDE